MFQVSLPANEVGSAPLQDLMTECVEWHADITNYTTVLTLQRAVLRQLRIPEGHWFTGISDAIFSFLMLVVPALLLNALPGQRAGEATILIWALLAATAGVALGICPALFHTAARNHLAWVHALVDEADVRRLHAWQRRWYNKWVITAFSVIPALAASLLVARLLAEGEMPAPLGSLYIGFIVFAAMMQNAVSMVLVVYETRIMVGCKTNLYRLSPADSLLIRQTLRGYNQLGFIIVFLFTPVILGLVFLVPTGSSLVGPAAGALLLIECIYTGLGSLVPRAILGRVVRHKKEEEMHRLQGWMEQLLARIKELTADEYNELQRLQATHDAIRNSTENLLPLGAVLRTVGALALSAITVLLTVFAQVWLGQVVSRLGG